MGKELQDYRTSVKNFMVRSRPAQHLHLLKLVGFLPGGVPVDLDRAKLEEKEDKILAEHARELADDQPDPPTNDGFLARKVQAKQELAQQENIEITVVMMFGVLVELVDRGDPGSCDCV